MNHSPGKLLKLFLALILTAGVLTVTPNAVNAHQGGFPSVGTDFGSPGPEQVTVLRDGAHTIYHPTTLGRNGVHHPVIIWGNGTFTSPQSYDGLLRHWASHGFIVAAANTSNAGSGNEMLAGMQKLFAWNTQSGHKFEGKVNMDTVGASGHSQGGGGALETGDHAKVTTTFPLQPWLSSASDVTGSVLLMSGQRDTVVSSASVLQKYNQASDIPAAFAELAGASHFAAMGSAGEYRYASTAWARMMLMDDMNAHGVFHGANAELATSNTWSDYRTNSHFNNLDHGGHGGGGDCEPSAPATTTTTAASSSGFFGWISSWLRGLFGGGTSSPAPAPAPAPDCEPTPTTAPNNPTPTTVHDDNDGHGHPTTTTAPANPTPTTVHDDNDGHGHPTTTTTMGHGDGGHDDGGHEPPADCNPQPYTATKPVELCGYPGVTPEQEAEAEALVELTLDVLPKWTVEYARSRGFATIGDSMTGVEHYINWSYMTDEHFLDPEYPESLVYEVQGSARPLVAAMYMMSRGDTLDDTPDFGGPMIQWHAHDDLCWSGPPETNPRVIFVAIGGTCLIGQKQEEVPMIHVWIVPHVCGPFSALEGISGGTPPDGEEQLCNDVHGHEGGHA